ncbi:exported hypothetical protein [Candidatus Terasakiella magnetica]|nr:exported hypothetical protein [Candidatus Terasakiella magnetica]
MTPKLSVILSAAALLALATPAGAAPQSSLRPTMAAEVMALGNPHPRQQIASADEARLESKRTEDRRRAELSEWETLFGRQEFPAMGVGGHER